MFFFCQTLDRFVCAVQKAMTHEFAPFVALLKTWNTVDTGNFDELLKTSNQRMYQRLRKLQLVQTCLISSFLEVASDKIDALNAQCYRTNLNVKTSAHTSLILFLFRSGVSRPFRRELSPASSMC